MGRNRSQWMSCLVLAAVVAGWVGHSRAEVSAELTATNVGVIVLGIIEGPDPIPQVIWEPVRDIAEELFLNPDGAVRGDGPPDIALDPITGWPHVVWAYNNGSDFDIAYSQWDGSAWCPVEFLSATATQDLDPRIYIDDSHVHVVWWDESTSAIRLIKRPRLDSWSAEETVSGHLGVRPSVVTWGGSVLVASETESQQGDRDILVSTRLGPSNYSLQNVGTVSHEDPLRVVLHSEQGKLWMDWHHSPTEFAYSEFNGTGWSAMQTVPWTSNSWVEFEQARLLIRAEVLSGP